MVSLQSFRIAVVTEDRQMISSHFGMAPYYQVFTIENGEIVARETRQKPFHKRHPDHTESHSHHHEDMFAPVADCAVLLCGGMGSPAYQKALAAGLKVVLVGGAIAENVQAYLQNDLESDPRRIHQH